MYDYGKTFFIKKKTLFLTVVIKNNILILREAAIFSISQRYEGVNIYIYIYYYAFEEL